ncbi:hypothetical protein EV143_104394 [Flavobacterium chryseum]|uniref:hypothetical protein n=1 Tax=Flavobacterium sp. P3160 TaxID=2512113 RepID=UPI00105B25EC|nr:hypothetical protein [Flavobacterium sp. P3160]TDO77627.1 hypothetical protein EV143_104394 [Flavobacterium sp. P3160]
MNKAEKIKFIKSQLHELEIHEELFKQGLSSITSRKRNLELELDSLGASNSTRKGKFELSPELKLQAVACLTK